MKIQQNPKVKEKFDSYPPEVGVRLFELRELILETAQEINPKLEVSEELKWGEPAYLTKKGSTIRMDWKAKSPKQFAMYFNCNSRLVETFRVLYGDLFRYEKNRALLFELEEEIPKEEIKNCIRMALIYHQVKDKPLLGN
ncbi:MAG: DUF1801 domain-containing protein [Bacteroidia bacterium]|nr:DUF1801 domain-containing protein [Bacteroidia bacterium]